MVLKALVNKMVGEVERAAENGLDPELRLASAPRPASTTAARPNTTSERVFMRGGSQA